MPGNVTGVHGFVDREGDTLTVHVIPGVTCLALYTSVVVANILFTGARGELWSSLRAWTWVDLNIKGASDKKGAQVQKDEFVHCAGLVFSQSSAQE